MNTSSSRVQPDGGWSFCGAQPLTAASGNEAEVTALMEARLNVLIDLDPLWGQLVLCVARGRERLYPLDTTARMGMMPGSNGTSYSFGPQASGSKSPGDSVLPGSGGPRIE